MKKTKVMIIQGYSTPYRNELFNLLADYDDIDLTLLYISKRGEDRKWKDNLHTRFNEVHVKCKVHQLSYVVTETRLSYLDFIIKVLRVNPDVVISVLSKYTILIKYLLLFKKVRLIHWSEATLVKENNTNWFGRKQYLKWHQQLPGAFLFPGRLAREYHEYCGFALNDNVFYAPNSVDADYSITDDELLLKFTNNVPLKFLFVGSFIEPKGFHILNHVFERLQKQKYNIELHTVGDGTLKPNDDVINHGFLNKKEMIGIYKQSHVFIMPSLADCNPLSLIEAAKTGNVLVASKGVGNHPELINGNGYTFEIGNADDLFNKCEIIAGTSRNDLLAMARRSIELAEKISHKNTAAAFYDAIRYVMRNSRSKK